MKIVKLYKELAYDKKEYVLSKQLLRSGTSIGALTRESEHAESKADFIHKLSIALKEANETDYWLELLNDTDFISSSEFNSYKNDIQEIIRLLVKILKTSKENKAGN
ncbi:MAG: four helix bundle protein [Candidatus Delongbacteria bacterium]|nr:four helix bundle protein [Candidatus Delongbacteria bacterium]